jgi:hypothetical protein
MLLTRIIRKEGLVLTWFVTAAAVISHEVQVTDGFTRLVPGPTMHIPTESSRSLDLPTLHICVIVQIPLNISLTNGVTSAFYVRR